MLLTKSLFKGTYIKNIHTNITHNNQKEWIFVSETSIDISKITYDTLLNEFVLESTGHQDFPFIIFDSSMLRHHLLLLTSIGLFCFTFAEGKCKLLFSETWNLQCEVRDKWMYIKSDEDSSIIVVYSNTNWFFIYHVNFNDNMLYLINPYTSVRDSYINQVNFYSVKGSDFVIVNWLFQDDTKYSYHNCIVSLTQRMVLKETFGLDNSTKKLYGKWMLLNAGLLMNKLEVSDIVQTESLEHLFFISDEGVTILKRNESDTNNWLEKIPEIENSTGYPESSFRFFIRKTNKDKYACFNSFVIGNNKLFIWFNNHILVYEEKQKNEKINLIRYKLKNKEDKQLIKNKNMVIIDESHYLFYDCKGSLIFVNLSINQSNTSEMIITKRGLFQNDGMFFFDSALCTSSIGNNNTIHELFGICGWKGESRLVKYVDGWSEHKLKEIEIGSTIHNIIIVDLSEKFKLIAFTEFHSTALRAWSKDWHLIDIDVFPSKILDMHKISDDEVYIVLDNQVISVKWIPNEGEINNIKIDKKNIIYSPPLDSSILLVDFCTYQNREYILLYLSNKTFLVIVNQSEMVTFNNYTLECSCISHLVQDNKMYFILGTYESYLNVYIINWNTHTLETPGNAPYRTKLTKEGNEFIPENIKVLNNLYILISSRDGFLSVFTFIREETSDKPMFSIFMTYQVSLNGFPVSIVNIESLDTIKPWFSIDWFDKLQAYNLILHLSEIDLITSKRKYLIDNHITTTENQEKQVHLKVFKKLMNSIYILINDNIFSISHFYTYNNIDIKTSNKILIHSNNNHLIANTVYEFQSTERAIKLVNWLNMLIVLTDASLLYIFENNNTMNSVKLTKIFQLDIKENFWSLQFFKMKLLEIPLPNEEGVITYLALCGEYISTEKFMNKINNNYSIKQGVLYLYEISNDDLFFVTLINTFPKPVTDICTVKNNFIVAIENYICVIPYELSQNNKLSINSHVNQIQCMNNVICLHHLSECLEGESMYFFAGDIKESVQLIQLNPMSSRLDTIASDLSLRCLSKIYPIKLNDLSTSIYITEKNGCLLQLRRNDQLYELENALDMKEYINRVYVLNSTDTWMTGIMGSVYYTKVFNNDMEKELGISKEDVGNLEVFMKSVFKCVLKWFLNRYDVDIETAMLMNRPVKKVIILDLLWNLCICYKEELRGQIKDFDNMWLWIETLIIDLKMYLE